MYWAKYLQLVNTNGFMKGSVHKELIEMNVIEEGLQSFYMYHFLKISKFLPYAGVILEIEGSTWKTKKGNFLQ